MCQQVTRAVHLLRAQIRTLRAQDSFDSRSSAGQGPLQALACSGITARTAGGRRGAGTGPAEPHGLRGFPRAPPPACAAPRPRALPARAPSWPLRECLTRAVYGGKSQIPGLGTQAWGKRVSAAGDSGPRPGSPPGRPRLVRASVRAPTRVPEWPGSSQPTLVAQGCGLLGPAQSPEGFFLSGVLCESSWLCPGEPGS